VSFWRLKYRRKNAAAKKQGLSCPDCRIEDTGRVRFWVSTQHRCKANQRVINTCFCSKEGERNFLGPPGVGKTHLAVGLAMQALRSGMTVYYASLAHLISDLKRQICKAN